MMADILITNIFLSFIYLIGYTFGFVNLLIKYKLSYFDNLIKVTMLMYLFYFIIGVAVDLYNYNVTESIDDFNKIFACFGRKAYGETLLVSSYLFIITFFLAEIVQVQLVL